MLLAFIIPDVVIPRLFDEGRDFYRSRSLRNRSPAGFARWWMPG
jgi:hypothetical protein